LPHSRSSISPPAPPILYPCLQARGAATLLCPSASVNLRLAGPDSPARASTATNLRSGLQTLTFIKLISVGYVFDFIDFLVYIH
jgi:hypothetical protein